MEPEATSFRAAGWILPGLAALFGIIGVAALVAAGRLWLRQKQATSWPSVVAKITASSVSRHEDSESVSFRCDLRYEFVVDGRAYEGRALAIGGSSGDEKGANEEHERYPPGAMATVYYNPAKPQDAILEQTGAKPNRVLLIVGGAFLASSLAILGIYRFL